jgi:hypothetical protein
MGPLRRGGDRSRGSLSRWSATRCARAGGCSTRAPDPVSSSCCRPPEPGDACCVADAAKAIGKTGCGCEVAASACRSPQSTWSRPAVTGCSSPRLGSIRSCPGARHIICWPCLRARSRPTPDGRCRGLRLGVGQVDYRDFANTTINSGQAIGHSATLRAPQAGREKPPRLGRGCVGRARLA